MNYHKLYYRGVMYDVEVNVGMSWRDCPFYKVKLNGEVIAGGIGDLESAAAAIKKAAQ
jgi:hypothetical protein